MPIDQCDIAEGTKLDLPNRTALATVRVGDLLNIEFRPGPPPLLVAMAKTGSGAGSINSPSARQIMECIRRGNCYVAEVLDLEGLACRVHIRRSKRGE